MNSYHQIVQEQARRNPCLNILSRFLTKNDYTSSCRILSLTFSLPSTKPNSQYLNIQQLRSKLQGMRNTGNSPNGILLIVEDLTPEIVELLGSSLKLDPLFFAIHVQAPQQGAEAQNPRRTSLPSRSKQQGFLNLEYYRTIILPDLQTDTKRFLRGCNVYRQMSILPTTKERCIGRVGHCCSILKKIQPNGTWIC